MECDHKYLSNYNGASVCTDCGLMMNPLLLNDKFEEKKNYTKRFKYKSINNFMDLIAQYGCLKCSIYTNNVLEDIQKYFSKNTFNNKKSFRAILSKYINENKNKIKTHQITALLRDIHYIYYKLTGIRPHDITYLHKQLVDDYVTLYNAFLKLKNKFNKKTNMLNNSFILFKLLTKYTYIYNTNNVYEIEDFVLTRNKKTIENYEKRYIELCKIINPNINIKKI